MCWLPELSSAIEMPYEPTLLDSPSTVETTLPSSRIVAISTNAGDAPSVPFRKGEVIVLPEKWTSGAIPIELEDSPLLAIPSDATTVPVNAVVSRPPLAG